ncbi:hypothetical protein MUY27_04290 [Mucilaginibacter sp. RS28]|uniref:Uncharacterized protein n=1 Tax=Mucilaginibacter straminoryzae TaxID=2932774 RepID=A0A9X1X2R9_9SPHI|nr:hypothetical protein [Mucilaginibacter straminoryzae]MCJ8208915.1 hypothetical protein [Mucilaginibacter straminoryzae]
MTAEIGLLNKSAVVIAADSAVTIGQGNKVYNNANKIYSLKHCNHIGIMIYNNANIMEIPVETIIRLYSIEQTATCRNLVDYSDSFLNFLSTFLKKHVTKEQVKNGVEINTYLTLDSITESVSDSISENIKSNSKKDLAKKKIELHLEVAKYILEDLKKTQIQEDLKKYDYDSFKQDYQELISSIIDLHNTHHQLSFNAEFTDLITEIIYYDSVREINSDDDFTGIIIAGFGEDEIYPGYIELHINGVINDTLRWRKIKSTSVNNEITAIVRPFAQRDMSDVFFRGVDTELYSKIIETLEDEYSEIDDYINKNFRLDEKKKEHLENFLNESINRIHKKITKISQDEYITPIIDTIDTFRKEDLIEIAESLISITSLKRKTSSNIQSVGGPVDIAVITKGEGFKWIKAKHLKIA